MRILHYFLGFPPYRSGGLTKYCFDLMTEQVNQKHTVMALWPGEMRVISKKIQIENRNSINGIQNYELINPLPVSLDEGILAFNEYMNPCDSKVYNDFLKLITPDVVHIHTLMGIHKEFVCETKKLKIRTVFTSHDYFGLCPKVTFYRNGYPCEDDNGCKACIQCNTSALSIKKIQILQSPLYRALKNSSLVRAARVKHRNGFFSEEKLLKSKVSDLHMPLLAEKYKELRAYYIGILSQIDMIHFNSSVTESIYKRFFIPKSSKVVTITHQNISDNRSYNEWEYRNVLRITCLAPAKPFKGFNILKNALDDLWDEGKLDFELKIFSSVNNISPYMKVFKNGYTTEQLASIFSETDIVIAPSVWYETFGFTVLEAISYGVPVIVSDHVGAKDVISEGGIIVEAGSVESLKSVIKVLTPTKVDELRKNIQKKVNIKTWGQFIDENYELYKG